MDTYKSNDKMNRNDYIFKGNEALDGVTLLHKTSTIEKINRRIANILHFHNVHHWRALQMLTKFSTQYVNNKKVTYMLFLIRITSVRISG